MVIFRLETSKHHIELQLYYYWSPVRSETGFVILGEFMGKFWSRFDLRQRRNRKFSGDDRQGCLSERTVHTPYRPMTAVS